MSTRHGKNLPKIEQERLAYSERSLLSQAMMLTGVVSLTLSMGGGLWLVWSVLDNGLMENLRTALVGLIPIGLAYLTAWIFAILSIRVYHNLVLPLLVRGYAWLILAGFLVLYIKVMQKLFAQGYQFPNFMAYNFILLAVLLALFGLHLLVEEHDLRPFSIPIFFAGSLQLGFMIVRYVLNPVSGNELYILGDLWIFALMQTIAGLMLAHNGLFNPLRQGITDYFASKRSQAFR